MNIPDNLIWPVVIGMCIITIGLFAVIRLTPALHGLIGRAAKVGKDGITFDHPQERGEQSTTLISSYEELMKFPMSNSTIAWEDKFKQQLHDYNLKTESEKISYLIRSLATTRVALDFNDIYYKIFGSQIKLLITLGP